MIVVVDSNVFFSALLTPNRGSALIYRAWLDDIFTLVSCEEQIVEIRNVSHGDKLKSLLKPNEVGSLINRLRKASFLGAIPRNHAAADSTDSFLLDLASAASAHFLVTGDTRSGLLQRKHVGSTRILSVADFNRMVLRQYT
jgi:hypothetical protein